MERISPPPTNYPAKTLRCWHDRISKIDSQPIQYQVGILLLGYALTIINPLLGLGALAIISYGYRNKYREPIAKFVDNNGLLLAILIPILSCIALATKVDPIAPDDLLRNLIVGEYYQYDYRKLYPISKLPAFDLWWGFDHALNWLQHFSSRAVVMWGLQLSVFGGLCAIITRSVALSLADRQDRYYWAGLAVAIVVYLSASRIISGRPEIVLSVWAVAAVLVRTRLHVILWTALGAALTATYWLAFLYFIAATLINRPLKQKCIAIFTLTLAHTGFWFVMFGEHYTQALFWLPQVMSNQIAAIGENAGLDMLLGNPAVVALLILVSIGLFTQNTKNLGWMAVCLIFFIASNQVRYIGTIAPLSVLLALFLWQEHLPKLTTRGMAGMAVLCVALLLHSASTLPARKFSPSFKQLPKNARVITLFSHATYAVPFNSPGIQIEPSYAFGAAPKDLQQLSIDIDGHGKQPDCATIHRYQFTHVVEQTMTSIPSCLELIEVNNKWRLWHVR